MLSRTVEEALEENHMTTLKELFKIAGMSEALDGMSNMTIFAPSERALSSLPQEMLEDLKANPEKLKEFLMYHVASPKTCKCEMENNKVRQCFKLCVDHVIWKGRRILKLTSNFKHFFTFLFTP